VVEAAKDEKRIEVGIGAASLGGSYDIDFIVETTSWKGRCDLAAFDQSSMTELSRHWIVDPAPLSPYATSMSYQRKMFFDGVNYWSFYFDGANTVQKYSADEGRTWISGGQVFATRGVNETSIWYDRSTSMVYAVGDTSSATIKVALQAGTVDPGAHKIAWASSDSSLNTSSRPLSGKNAFISKDANGYLWVLCSNLTQGAPAAYQLSAFRSAKVNSTDSWVLSGQMLPATSALDNIKGSIVPSGSGNDVWAVYGYGGNVAARKCAGTWQPQQVIYAQAGSKANTDNSPPSVVVDGKGVVHVVYGTGRRAGPASAPTIEYSHNLSGQTTFTPGVNLDPLIASGIGDYYPTISLDTATGNLYVLWVQSDPALVPSIIVCKKGVAGAWSDFTIEQQTSYTKLFLTSVYSVPGESGICWQWNQNATAPIEVFYDNTQIPELHGLAAPLVSIVALFFFYRRNRPAPKR
jgi:hypothetical protein